MKQAILRKGTVFPEDIPAPIVSDGSVLIKVVNSCISAGTEMAAITSSGTPLIRRVLDQPEKVRKVLKLALSDGIKKIYKQVKGELDAGKPVGYSVSGVVIARGEGVRQFEIGDRVAAAGGGLAYHAEYVDVPVNLVVKIPGDLPFREASTVTLGAIALHGTRRADLKLGEYCVVMGTGILGLLSIQILKAAGVRVIAIDPDERRLQIARELGAEFALNPTKEDPVKTVENYTSGYCADAVLFTASTGSSEPLSQSFRMCRRKGRVVLVGVSGMEIDRKDMYAKEIDFIISTSYGPGRYDPDYEEKGIDYPYSYVRWTENRNLAEYLRLLSSGLVNLDKMLEKVFPIDQVKEAFESLEDPQNKPLLILLDYGVPDPGSFEEQGGQKREVRTGPDLSGRDILNVALIGTGNFAKNMHLPNLSKLQGKFRLYAVADKSGPASKSTAEQYGASCATTDPVEIFKDEKVDLVLICTRHDSHGPLVLQALEHGKHVFVEKPLATRLEELEKIEDFYQGDKPGTRPLLFVGYNRRFSKYAGEIRSHLIGRIGPAILTYTMNAGYIPPDQWVHENGGRIVGEACHIIDLFHYLVDEPVVSLSTESIHPEKGKFSASDNKSMIFKFRDGSLATLVYLANGNPDYPKERLEVHFDEKTIVLNDFKSLEGFGLALPSMKSSTPEKGHFEEWIQLHKSLKNPGSEWPIPLQVLLETTRLTLMIE
jgi:predicted dehydrogenase/threonine dehydrogenase-like Zn-dependent dehydrogenase